MTSGLPQRDQRRDDGEVAGNNITYSNVLQFRDHAMSSVEQQAAVLDEMKLLQASSSRIEQHLTAARIIYDPNDVPGDKVLEFVVRRLDSESGDRYVRMSSLRDEIRHHIRRSPETSRSAGCSTSAAINLPRVREESLRDGFLASLSYSGKTTDGLGLQRRTSKPFDGYPSLHLKAREPGPISKSGLSPNH